MKSIKLLTQLHVSVFGHSTDVSSGIIQMEGDKHLIQTFEFVKLFPIKISRFFSGRKFMPTSLTVCQNNSIKMLLEELW
jgi:hypothetical protein